MTMSVLAIIFTIVLFSELNSHLIVVAMSSTKAEDGAPEQEGLDFILGDETMTEPAVGPLMYRRSVTDKGTPKVIIVSDTRLGGHGVRGLNSAFIRSYPQLSERSLSHTPGEFTLKIDKRDQDIELLRCMIGRVYRPCWET